MPDARDNDPAAGFLVQTAEDRHQALVHQRLDHRPAAGRRVLLLGDEVGEDLGHAVVVAEVENYGILHEVEEAEAAAERDLDSPAGRAELGALIRARGELGQGAGRGRAVGGHGFVLDPVPAFE